MISYKKCRPAAAVLLVSILALVWLVQIAGSTKTSADQGKYQNSSVEGQLEDRGLIWQFLKGAYRPEPPRPPQPHPRLPDYFTYRYNPSRVSEHPICGKSKNSWAYAAVAALEGQQQKHHLLDANNQVIELDARELIQSYGIPFDYPRYPFDYVMYRGLSLRSRTTPCRGCSRGRMMMGMKFNNQVLFRNTPEYPTLDAILKMLYEKGPIMVGLAEGDIAAGNYKNPMPCKDTQIALVKTSIVFVLLIGYDEISFTIKGFKGPEWGEEGYARIERKTGCNPFTIIVPWL